MFHVQVISVWFFYRLLLHSVTSLTLWLRIQIPHSDIFPRFYIYFSFDER
jgi:hypothetical protein